MTEPDTAQPQETPERRDIRENKDIAAVSYLWIMAPIVYFARKDSAFIQFHAKQAMVLFVISIPLWFIPVIGHYLELFILAGMVMGFLNAFQGQRTDVPLIGPVARGERTPVQALAHLWGIIKETFRKLVGKKTENNNPASGKEETPPPPPPPPPASTPPV